MENDKLATNKEEGLRYKITATGREVDVKPVVGTSLWRLGVVDGKVGGHTLPAKYSGRFTSYKEACFWRDTLIAETWDVAAEHTPKKKAANA